MICPFCSKTDTRVLESRIINDAVRRRRECIKCSNRFTTYEKAELHLKVLKKMVANKNLILAKLKEALKEPVEKLNQN